MLSSPRSPARTIRIFSSDEYRLPRLTANVLDRALCGILMPLCLLSHRSLLKGDDEPKTLPYAIASVGPMSADVRQQGQDRLLRLAGWASSRTGTRFAGVHSELPRRVFEPAQTRRGIVPVCHRSLSSIERLQRTPRTDAVRLFEADIQDRSRFRHFTT